MLLLTAGRYSCLSLEVAFGHLVSTTLGSALCSRGMLLLTSGVLVFLVRWPSAKFVSNRPGVLMSSSDATLFFRMVLSSFVEGGLRPPFLSTLRFCIVFLLDAALHFRMVLSSFTEGGLRPPFFSNHPGALHCVLVGCYSSPQNGTLVFH